MRENVNTTFLNFVGTSVSAEVEGFTVFTALEATSVRHWSGALSWEPGKVYLDDPSEYEPIELDPTQARALAAALLRGAEEAEWMASGGVPRRPVTSTAHLTSEDLQAATRRLADRLHHSRPENQEDV